MRKLLARKERLIESCSQNNFGYVTDRYSRDLLELKFSKDGETMKYRYWRERNSPAGQMREFCDSLYFGVSFVSLNDFPVTCWRRKRESYYDRNNNSCVKDKLKAEEEDLKERRESQLRCPHVLGRVVLRKREKYVWYHVSHNTDTSSPTREHQHVNTGTVRRPSIVFWKN